MLENLLGKMQEAQKLMQETKEKLNDIILESESEGVKVTITANRESRDIKIDHQLIDAGYKEALEELVLAAINNAMDKAAKRGEEEVKKTAGGMFPGMSGLFG